MEFIPYTQALELKQLGFNEPCWVWYNIPDEDVRYCYSEGRNPITNIQEEWDAKIDGKPVENIGLPTFSQAFRWFREKYNLCGEIYTVNMGAIDYTFQIRDLYSEDVKHDNFEAYTGGYIGTFNTYEAAELVCLDKLIEITKKQ